MAYVLHRFIADLPYASEPGVTTWHYVRISEGEFAPISQARLNRFFKKKEKAPAPPDQLGFLYLYTAEVDRATKIIKAEFNTKLKVLPDGNLDYFHWLRGCAYSPYLVAAALHDHGDAETQSKLAEFTAEYRWEATPADLDALTRTILVEKRPPVGLRPV